MGIDYLPDALVGGKIDLSKFENKKKPDREKYLPALREGLDKLAAETNNYFPDFLNSEGKINLEGKDSDSDTVLVSAQEGGFSKAQNKDIKTWQRDTERNPANLTEMALTIMLHKFLKENFIVARASSYDDYNNGVDQVIVYKETGEVICGFDEVIGNVGDDGGAKKAEKFANRKRGMSTSIKYGAKLSEGKLVRSEVKNVPAFFMSLSKDELDELLEALKTNSPEISPVEERIFAKLINSLAEQTANLQAGDLQIKAKLAIARLKASFVSKN